jgi:hypothetical protein
MSGPKYAIVNPADYERLKGYEWFLRKGRNSFYSLRYIPERKYSKKPLIYMHQEIIQVPKGMVVDHINNNGMDNRVANLRAATRAQNIHNRKKFIMKCASKYKGVSWHKHHRKWSAGIGFNNKLMHLGYFHDEIDAAKAYDEAAKKYHGEFACLNFPK